MRVKVSPFIMVAGFVLGSASCMFLLDTESLKKGEAAQDGGATADGGDGGVDPQALADACDRLANAYCAKVESCAPFFRNWIYGDAATCIQRYKLGCAADGTASGTTFSPDSIKSCATTVTSLNCGDLYTKNANDACVGAAGPRAANSACGVDGQCQTSYCRIDPNQQCGSCQAKGGANGSCSQLKDCDVGLTCESNKCVPMGGTSTACGPGKPCKPDLACVSSACQKPLGTGATCTADITGLQPDKIVAEITRECDVLHGLYCNPVSKKCEDIKLASAGADCGLVKNTGLVFCTKSGKCVRSGVGGSKCIDPLADGATCTTAADDPTCLSPAICFGAVCKIPDRTQCN